MSEVADDAVVRILIADYAATDASSKLNVVGGGITGIGFVPKVGQTSAFALVVSIAVPPKHYNAECAVEIRLEDSGGNPISVPGPAGQAQVMRIKQAVRFEEPPPVPGIPGQVLRSRTQWVIGFATGLPLPIGQVYTWRIRIDHHTRDDWTEQFYIPGLQPGPAIG